VRKAVNTALFNSSSGILKAYIRSSPRDAAQVLETGYSTKNG
jgi:hypothetical protein